MSFNMSVKLILIVALQAIFTTKLTSTQDSGQGWPSILSPTHEWSFTQSHTDTLSEFEINTVLTNQSERTRLEYTLDQITYERPEQVPSCRFGGYIYDAIAKVCSFPSVQEHCGQNMIFKKLLDAEDLGSCACSKNDYPPCFGRPKVLTSRTQCGAIGTQGPCNVGETMVPITKFSAVCGPDACLNMAPQNAINFSKGSREVPNEFPVFNFSYEGTCYTTESEAFCQRGQVVRFILPYKIPVCVNPNGLHCEHYSKGYGLGNAFVTNRDCEEGLTLNPKTNVCHGQQNFDFQ